MNPSQKYMPHTRSTTDEDDLNLVPFITGRQTPLTDQSNFSMSTTGWIPVYFFNNPPFNQMGNVMGAGMAPGFGTGLGSSGLGTSTGTSGLGTSTGASGLGTSTGTSGLGTSTGTSGLGTSTGTSGLGTSTGTIGLGTGSPNSSTFKGSFTLPTLPNMNTTSSLDSDNFYPFTPSTNSSNRELPNIIDLLSNFDLNLDEDIDLARNCSDTTIDEIYEKIDKNHPEIFALVRAYNIPYPIFKLLIRRVIKLSKKEDE